MWNNVRGNTSWSNLCHARVSEPFELLCTTHRGRKISQYYYAVHKIIRRFRKYTCKHVRATRKRRNLRPFLKRDCVSITLRSWNAAIVSLDPIPFCCHTKHVRNASWGNGDYVLVYHRPLHCCVLPVRACVQVPLTISGERYLFQLLLLVPRT